MATRFLVTRGRRVACPPRSASIARIASGSIGALK
jgi:hypothetical protein